MIRVVSWDTLLCYEEILMSISCSGFSNPGGLSGKSTKVGDVEVELKNRAGQTCHHSNDLPNLVLQLPKKKSAIRLRGFSLGHTPHFMKQVTAATMIALRPRLSTGTGRILQGPKTRCSSIKALGFRIGGVLCQSLG